VNREMKPIYLDHNATTPITPEARDAMAPFMDEEFGNPSCSYRLGKRGRDALETARGEVADLIGANSGEVVFTSGGSESNNYVIKGMVDYGRPEATHIITSGVEHPAILNPALFLMEIGVEVTVLPVDRTGKVDPDDVKNAIRPNTRLITIMLANNETGTLQPIKEIARIGQERGISIHTDAAQAVGKIPVDVNTLGVDFLSLAGHKLYAPKGVGALYIRNGHSLTPLIHGGGQEGGKRAGTENVMFAVGLGTACTVARKKLDDDFRRMKMLRDRLETRLFSELDGLVCHGDPEARLPNTLYISVPGMDGNEILKELPDIMASTGAACHGTRVKLSHVLSAMGVRPEIGMGAIRLTTGRSNTTAQIDTSVEMITDCVHRMRRGK
jgi:cysteine desulfurase